MAILDSYVNFFGGVYFGNSNWIVLNDEPKKRLNKNPYQNKEQMSNWLGVAHSPEYCSQDSRLKTSQLTSTYPRTYSTYKI